MYNPEFLNTSWRPVKTSKGRQAPGVQGPSKTMGMKVTHLEPPQSNQMKGRKLKWVGKRKYRHIKLMFPPFQESVQTHPLQIFLHRLLAQRQL